MLLAERPTSGLRRGKNATVLQLEFERLRRDHPTSVLLRCARSNLGASVIRVFAAGTKPLLTKALEEVAVDELRRISSEDSFKAFFERELSQIARVIKRTNPDNTRIYPGYKWGHASKVLCLFLRDVVSHSRYLHDSSVNRITPLLFVPIDGLNIRRLLSLGITLPFRKIKEIDSPSKFYAIQEQLGEVGRLTNVPRIWFDDNWASRAD